MGVGLPLVSQELRHIRISVSQLKVYEKVCLRFYFCIPKFIKD